MEHNSGGISFSLKFSSKMMHTFKKRRSLQYAELSTVANMCYSNTEQHSVSSEISVLNELLL